MPFEAAGAGSLFACAAAAVVLVDVVLGRAMRQTGCFFGQGKERLTLDTTKTATRGFFQKKDDKRENQTEADGQSEWDDRHGDQDKKKGLILLRRAC